MTTVPHEIRALTTPADYQACAALQEEIWGNGFQAAPSAILHASAQVGGIAAGAFSDDGRLAGFVFGLTGVDVDGAIVHWSHVLGVRPELRNAGLGRRLKEFQRCELARRNISRMYWTYDPLIAKNAHFNLNVLGARVVRFVPDMYGQTGSPLHHGLPTDRCVVVTDTSRAPHEHSVTLEAADRDAPVLSVAPRADDIVMTKRGQIELAPRVRLEIPTDFAQLLADAPTKAVAWHTAVREDFLWAVGNGYTVSALRRDPGTSRSFYILEMQR
jgi:predicted GNAT superfamily acetyltransferase